MKNIKVSPEALINAAHELKKRSRAWLDEAEGISSPDCRSKMKECGSIIEEYAVLLEKISREYDETGRRLAAAAGDIYEQVR